MEVNQDKKFIDRILTLPSRRNLFYNLILSLRVFYVSTISFLKDDCLVKASGIAYTIIVSLVPMLTVGLALVTLTSGFSSKKEELFEYITLFLTKNHIPLDVTPYIKTLDDIVNSATQIGAVGFVVLIFSATAVLRTFEDAFNHIWQARSSRTFFNKIIFYFFLLSIGPLLFFIVIGYVSKFSEHLREPHYKSIHKVSSEEVWVAGEKGTLVKYNVVKNTKVKVTSKMVDTENIFCLDKYGLPQKHCDFISFGRQDIFKIVGFQEKLFAMSSSGSLFVSKNAGGAWEVYQFSNIEAKNFAMPDENTIYIINEKGEVLVYSFVEKPYILNINPREKVVVNQIVFVRKDLAFFLDHSGGVWKTIDNGKTFSGGTVSSNDFRSIIQLEKKLLMAVGEKGVVFTSTDDGNTWSEKLSHHFSTFKQIGRSIKTETEILVILTDLGELLCSFDRGERWYTCYKNFKGEVLAFQFMTDPDKSFYKKYKTLPLVLLNHPEKNKLKKEEINSFDVTVVAVGEFGKIIVGGFKDVSLLWKHTEGGTAFFSLYSFFRFIFPLLAIWLFFTLLYSLIPNTKVPVKASVAGAAITGFLFLIFIMAFGIYIRSFAKSTLFIYQTLAIVPIFLLYIYCLCIIILFGAEITATLHHKERYLLPIDISSEFEGERKRYFYLGIKLLVKMYFEFNHNGKLLTSKRLSVYLSIQGREFEKLLLFLSTNQYIVVSNEGDIAPVRPADKITLYEYFINYSSEMLNIEEDETEIGKKVSSIIQNMNEAVKTQLSSISFADLI
jgi:membrane protein